jgi:uncharacterized protein with PIN domain
MKFLVDSTAGKLSRWLRVMGHDVSYVSTLGPGEMLQQARREGRILLSRNRSLAARNPAVATTLEADDLVGQLRQIGRRFPLLETAAPFTRCLVCNGALEPRPKEQARNRVPDYVFQTQEGFGYCPFCDRFYWKATHWEQMRETLRGVFGAEFPDPGPAEESRG